MEKRKGIQLCIVNESDEKKNAVILGSKKYISHVNFGSDSGIRITTTESNKSYIQELNESGDIPFETPLIRVQSNNYSQIEEEMYVVSESDNGEKITIPLNIKSYISKDSYRLIDGISYEVHKGIVDVHCNCKINEDMYFEYSMLPKTTVVITIFPKL